MWGNTKTFKVVYYDNKVMSGDKKRSTFIEAYDRNDAIYKFHQDFGQDYVVRDCTEFR